MAIDIIGINNFLNLILVNEHIKPAFLLSESIRNEITTPDLLSEITKAFPLLKQSINYTLYDGIIFSQNDYNHYKGSSISLQNIESLLGFPFYENFNHTTNNYNTYTINFNVQLKNGSIENLFTNICMHITEDIIELLNIFAETATDTFHKEPYINLLGDFAVIELYTEIISNISPDIIIQKLLDNIKLENDDFYKIQEIFINLNFTHNFQIFFNSYFQENNNIHKGILIGIIINSKHSLLTPVQEIPQYKTKYNEIQNIVNEWETNLMLVITQTRVNPLFCLF